MAYPTPTAPILVFDIETIPDVASGRRLYPNLAKLGDDDVRQAMIAMRQAQAGTDFMQLPLHQVACISLFWWHDGKMKLSSFSLESLSEKQIIAKFFAVFEGRSPAQLPQLVSWNGTGFDIPVLMYRAMHHKLSAPSFFDENSTRDIQYNNYLRRYHDRHTDLMDKLTLFAGFSKQPLDVVAGVCGLAGKGDNDGSMVSDMAVAGDWQRLTTYCESDVLNTWLLYVRWLLLTGKMDFGFHEQLEQLTHGYLTHTLNEDGSVRHQAFLDSWVVEATGES